MSERQLYGLTPSQQAIFLQRRFSMNKACVNIPTTILLNQKLDHDLLEDAIRTAIGRWDSFGLRLTKAGKEIKQYFGERSCQGIFREDFTGKPEAMAKFIDKKAKKAIKIMESPMVVFYILTTPEGNTGMFSIYSHMMMDSWAISMFYKDVVDIYYAKLEGQPLPKPVRDYEPLLKKELEYPKSPAHERAAEFWNEELNREEPIFIHPNSTAYHDNYRKKKGNENVRFAPTFFLFAKGRHEMLYISAEDVKKMTEFITLQKLPSLQVLYQMGLRMHLAKVNGNQADVSFYNVVARRGTLEEKMTGGTRVHFFMDRTFMPEGTTFREGLDLLLEKQNGLYRHADFSPFEMWGIESKYVPAKRGMGYRTVSLTFQPIPMLLGHGLTAKISWHSNGGASQPLYITVMDGDGEGSLKCYYEHNVSQVSQEDVIRLHRNIVRVILAGIENPGMTVGEIFELL